MTPEDLASADRYHRQRLLPQIGPAGQARLAAARALLIGVGALGSAAAELLARAGVGFLRIVDRDLVERTNLQRQLLFSERDAANELPKAIAAAARLRQINSSVEIDAIVADVNAANIGVFCGESEARRVDIIIDGTDNVSTRYLINDVAVKGDIPWIYGGCVGVEGRVMGIWPGRTACLRCLFPDPPAAGNLPACDTTGVLGPAAGAVASLQAAFAMRFLVEGPPSRSPGLITLDAWNGVFRSMQSAATPRSDCPCCGRRNFAFLSTESEDFTTTLCGRNAVQVLPNRASAKVDLAATAQKWQSAGTVSRTAWFIRCRLLDPAEVGLTLFPDGRLLVHGTTEPIRAKSLYARYVGT